MVETNLINPEKLIKDLKGFLALAIRQLGSGPDNGKAFQGEINDVIDDIYDAQSSQDLMDVKNVYKKLILRLDQSQPPPGNPGNGIENSALLMEIPKRASEGFSLVTQEEEFLKFLVDLTVVFAKGALLMLDEDHPLENPVKLLKNKEAENLEPELRNHLQKGLGSFFYAKSNEIHFINKEREELKGIIHFLAGQIGSLSLTSDEFQDNLTRYSEEINKATKLDEIILVKQKILKETDVIREENTNIKNSMTKMEGHLQSASEKIQALERELERTRLEMQTDPLTGIYNRGAFNQKMKERISHFKRYKEPFSLLIFDVDHFKKFNDTYGHQVGDGVLKGIAGLAMEPVRETDFLARYGGEEFAVLLDKVESSAAFSIAEKIRKVICTHEFLYKKKPLTVSISIGGAICREGDTEAGLIKRADQALYQAKKEGRNRTVMAE